MEEIKSVRVRKSVPSGDENTGSGDIKVTLFKDRKFFRDIRIVRGTQANSKPGVFNSIDGRVIWGDSEYSGSRYENQPDEYIIDDFIRVNTVSKGFPQTVNDNSGEVVNYYEIVQDPYDSDPPRIRNFGYDPYYLNNGAVLYISWQEMDTSGKIWNRRDVSNNAVEFEYENQMRDHFFYNLGNTQSADSDAKELFDKKSAGKKSVFCIYKKNGIDEKFYISEGEEVQVVGTNMMSRNYIFTTDSSLQKKYNGDITDEQIYLEFLNRWNFEIATPNDANGYSTYQSVYMCKPNNIECESIKYVSPLKSKETLPVITPTPAAIPADAIVATSSVVEKFKLSIVLPDDLKLKVKEDLPSLKVYLGDAPIDFVFQDFDEFDPLLDEYTEEEFKGEEESVNEVQFYINEQVAIETESQASILNSEPYVQGKHKLDLIPGNFYTNGPNRDGNGPAITCCQINGKPVNVKIADALIDMINAAKKDGITITVNSGFRPARNPSISTKSALGISVSSQSQESLYAEKLAGKTTKAVAKPGQSRHGNGIAVDLNTGTKTGVAGIQPMPSGSERERNYIWLAKNSWRFGFIRAVGSEEWHYEYWPDKAKLGPYAILKDKQLFYSNLGLSNLTLA